MLEQSQYKYYIKEKAVSREEFNSTVGEYIVYVDDFNVFKLPKKAVLDSFFAENKEKEIISDWNRVELPSGIVGWTPTFKIADYNTNSKETEGVKLNKNKSQLSLLFTQFPKALEAIVKCSEYGHNKYKETDSDYLNFKRVEGGSKAYADAGLRHRLETGNDLESGLPHAYHVCWNALAELELLLENK